jgi:hypothetical protein
MNRGLRGFGWKELGAASESEKSSNYKVHDIWIVVPFDRRKLQLTALAN